MALDIRRPHFSPVTTRSNAQSMFQHRDHHNHRLRQGCRVGTIGISAASVILTLIASDLHMFGAGPLENAQVAVGSQ
jgi:hypothetical protein